MRFCTIIRRDFRSAPRLVFGMVIGLTLLAGSGRAARAGLIRSFEPNSAEQFLASLDKSGMSSTPSLGVVFQNLDSFGGEAWFSNLPSFALLPKTVPQSSEPIEPVRLESPFVALGFPRPTTGASAESESSNRASEPSEANAASSRLFDPPPPILLGCLYDGTIPDCHPAPPFELLRPPRLTVLA